MLFWKRDGAFGRPPRPSPASSGSSDSRRRRHNGTPRKCRTPGEKTPLIRPTCWRKNSRIDKAAWNRTRFVAIAHHFQATKGQFALAGCSLLEPLQPLTENSFQSRDKMPGQQPPELMLVGASAHPAPLRGAGRTGVRLMSSANTEDNPLMGRRPRDYRDRICALAAAGWFLPSRSCTTLNTACLSSET